MLALGAGGVIVYLQGRIGGSEPLSAADEAELTRLIATADEGDD